ncbi:Phycocyanobilin lyase subunit CpcS [Galdieria sulphuraria]|nr:Phycocyanobilin lyase subunit CpcS [Galdieria sulphuraria]
MEKHDTFKALSFCNSCLIPIRRPCHGLAFRNTKFPSRNQSWWKGRNVTLAMETSGEGELRESPYALYKGEVVNSPDPKNAMDFFRLREGQWSSWRVTHHLAFRRDEQGVSDITMKVLEKSDPRIVELCEAHHLDPSLAAGGCYVEWAAQLSWDQEGENHEGSTVFAIVPDDAHCCSGKLLRDRGYAEIVQVAGTFRLTPSKELVLHTPYDGGDVEETFSFIGKDLVIRSSTVKRFGGFSTATFSTERRKDVGPQWHPK